MNTKLTRGCFLLAAWLGLITVFPAKAASLQAVTNWVPGGVPTNLSMYVYIPDNVAPNPPILVLLHYWGGTAGSVFEQARGGGIVAAADQYGFIMVVPQRATDCWDYGSAQALTRDGGGETHGIAQMVRYAITNYHANATRVYVTGDSCGGMMTEALLGVYPDIFKAGAAFAGVPIGGAWTPVTHTAQEWGNLARAAYPGYTGPRPRVQLWHGTADGTVSYSNHVEAIMQWGNVLGLSTNPTTTTTVIIPGIANQWTHQVWKDTNGATLLDAWSDIGGDHGPSDALFNARHVIPFLGLDKVGPVDLGAGGQRGRPKLNAARTTFVGDNGQPLRGPYASTEWTGATSYEQIAKMKTLGFNAVHLYGESFDPSYPTNGSTAPGYALSRIDSIVQSTRDLGLYLVLTIGNGAANGKYNRAWITNFWNLYAPRYANETHVLFEIQNEPVAWGPPYSSPTATPPGALDMEVAAYKTIRAHAPNTPVLLFSYAVLGGAGAASAAITDINAFNTAVFGTANVVWTNEAVAFHGYGGWDGTIAAVTALLNAGHPCFMTEFGWPAWGTSSGVSLEVEVTTDLERLGVSWLTFQYIPPTGVSDDVTLPELFKDRVNNAGLSWTPDYGTWPVARGVFGNNGQPRSTVANWVNSFLTGTLRIQAEDFDKGGEGVACHDTDPVNSGGQYRPAEVVDLYTCNDTAGGYMVGGTADGEWLEYTILVREPGFYALRLRYAAPDNGSTVKVISNARDTNGPWALPATGGSATWATSTQQVYLKYGRQKVRLEIQKGGFNLNWLELSPASTGIIANGNYKFLNGANALAMLGVTSTNSVVATSYSGTNMQQWNLQHMGGGQYKVTSVGNGRSWNASGDVLGLVSSWSTSDDRCFIILPTGGGFHRFVPVSSGLSLAIAGGNPANVVKQESSGSAFQQWAIMAPVAPAFPIGLSATANSATQMQLKWNAVSGATSYNVKRSTTSGGPYLTFATGVTTTNYTDTVIAGMKYYYVVSAVFGGVESQNSLEASVNPPYPWATQDVGSFGLAGSVSFNNGLFTVTGAGNDIWNAADAFRYVYLTNSGNCTITARVPAVQNTDGWAKAGVMIRASLNANSANAFVAVTPGYGVTWQTRSSTGASTGNNAAAGLTAPYWVRLVRSGSTFTGYRSANGVTWTQMGSTTISMGTTMYVGLAVTAHNSAKLCTATFDNVTFPGWPNWTLPPAPATLAAILEGAQVVLSWPASSTATSYNLKRATTNGGPYTILANTATTNYTDVALTSGTTYYYVVSALNPAGESGNSVQANATPQFFPPTGVSAVTLSASQIDLAWNAVTNAISYNVKRSLTNGGSYAAVATGLTATNYQDGGLAGGTIYYYVVSAVVSGGETPDSVQVTATTQSPTVGSLVHRYSFSETGGSTIADVVGGPIWSGTLPSGGTLSGGQLTLSSSSLQYAALPAGIVSSLSNFTVMAWVNLASVSDWSRIFEFGNGTATNLYLTPRNGLSGTLQFGMTTNGSAEQINCAATVSTGAWHQVAVTLSSGVGVLYLDGVAVGTNSSLTINPSSLGSTMNNWIGKSQYAVPSLNGALDEFRIYRDGLSAAEIAATAALGPNQLLSTNSPALSIAGAGADLMLSWPLACAGYALQTRANLASGDWVNVTSPEPQIIGDQWRVVLPLSGDSQPVFYRLSK
jgi:endoglucanase